MPVYRYRGRKFNSSAVVSGERFAPGKQALAAALREDQIFPITIVEKPTRRGPAWSRGVSPRQLALLTRQFSVMLSSGLPLVECLELLAEQQDHPAFQAALRQIRMDVGAGAMLHEAMARYPRFFDPLFISMISAGEIGGALEEVLKRLSVFAEKSVKLRRAVLSASVYPAIVIAVAAAIVLLIMVWVVPAFATLFASLDVPLPAPTRMVMHTGELMARFAIPTLLLTTLALAGARRLYKTASGRLAVDRLTLAIPGLRTVHRKVAISRFARTLSTLLTSGIPIIDALQITAATSGNRVVQDAILSARNALEDGKKLADSLRTTSLFPAMVTQIVAVGEQTGKLDQMLEKLADYYEEESDSAIASVLTMLEPILIVFLGTLIGGIVVSMYLPIFGLIGRLASGG